MLSASSSLQRLLRFAFYRLFPERARNVLAVLLDEPNRPPRVIEQFGERNVVVLAPHPDDETIGCGGTLHRHALAGSAVTVVYLTDGRRGNPQLYQDGVSAEARDQSERLLASIRKDEATRAAEILGIQERIFLEIPDRHLEVSGAIIQTLQGIIEARAPSVVYLPSPLDLHSDHWTTNAIFRGVLDSSRTLQASVVLRGYEVHAPVLINAVADIGSVVDVKRRALAAFKSQNEHIDYLRTTLGLNAYRSIRPFAGRGYAEAFYECTPAEYRQMFERLTRR